MNDENYCHVEIENNNDNDFLTMNEKMMFEKWKNRMYYETKMMDFDDVMKMTTMKMWKKNISNDDENEEMEIDDDVDIEMMWIGNDGDGDDEHNEYSNDPNDDDDGNNNHHFVDRILLENNDDNGDQKTIFDDIYYLMWEWVIHDWISSHELNCHVLKIV